MLNLVPGSTVTFSVHAINARSYRWIHNGETIHGNDRYYGIQTNILRISRVQESDEGSYQCVVWNELSLQSDEAVLTVCKYMWRYSTLAIILTTVVVAFSPLHNFVALLYSHGWF